MEKVAAIVLAAGEGTRMDLEDDTNKVVLEIEKKPMISRTIANLIAAGIKGVVVVIGHGGESVKEVLGDSVTYAVQPERKGTGHAVNVGLTKIDENASQVISVYGDDSAFYPPSLIIKLAGLQKESKAAITLLTIKKSDPTGLGRIVRDKDGNITEIVEEKVASKEIKKITEINTGLYCFDAKFLRENIDKIQKNPISGEYYLTDIIEIAVKQGLVVKSLFWEDESVWHGVNTPEELTAANKRMSDQ